MEKELHTNESNNIDIHSTSLERKLSLALHKRYPVIWAADNIQELVLDDKATVENVYDVLAEIEDKCDAGFFCALVFWIESRFMSVVDIHYYNFYSFFYMIFGNTVLES